MFPNPSQSSHQGLWASEWAYPEAVNSPSQDRCPATEQQQLQQLFIQPAQQHFKYHSHLHERPQARHYHYHDHVRQPHQPPTGYQIPASSPRPLSQPAGLAASIWADDDGSGLSEVQQQREPSFSPFQAQQRQSSGLHASTWAEENSLLPLRTGSWREQYSVSETEFLQPGPGNHFRRNRPRSETNDSSSPPATLPPMTDEHGRRNAVAGLDHHRTPEPRRGEERLRSRHGHHRHRRTNRHARTDSPSAPRINEILESTALAISQLLDEDSESERSKVAQALSAAEVLQPASEGWVHRFCSGDQLITDDNEEEDPRERECNICMDYLGTNGGIRLLHNNHKFCAGCIERWLEDSDTCPLCRATGNW